MKTEFEKEIERRKSFYLNEDKEKEFEKYKDKYSMIANRVNLIIKDSLSRINYKYSEEERQKVYNYIEYLLANFARMYCEDYDIDFKESETGQITIANSFVYDRMWIDVFELYEFLGRVTICIENGDIENVKRR